MIMSMTGFGQSKIETESFSVTVEIRSVNHRFLDCHIRIPQQLMKLEDKIKKAIQEYVSRGRVDCFITIDGLNLTNRHLHIDWNLIDEYYQFITVLKERYNIQEEVQLSHLLEMDELVTIAESEEENAELESIIIQAVKAASQLLTEMRRTEGNELEKDLHNHLNKLEKDIEEVLQFAPNVVKQYKEKLTKKMLELTNGAVDEERILTEAAIFSDRSDITEEIIRIKSHIRQFHEALTENDPIGRKLDFLVQELNREVNTIGSKANDVQISRIVVEMKSIIEKLKEQVQNIE